MKLFNELQNTFQNLIQSIRKNKMILKEFIGTKCFACGDEMNFDYPAFYPTWSDFYDNIICEDCDNKNKRAGF